MLKTVLVSTALCFQIHLGVPYSNLIHRYACPKGINPILVASIIRVESNFNPKASHRETNGDTSRGLMQIEERTARHAGYSGPARKLYNPAVNIRTGVDYLSELVHRYRSVGSVISAYNAGTAVWIRGYGFINRVYVRQVFRCFLEMQNGLEPVN